MAEITLIKGQDGALRPIDQQSHDILKKYKFGQGIACDIKKQNNPAFHRKLMALFNLGFECWEPGEIQYKGVTIEKNFDRFRKDITIMAGFGIPSFNFKGEIRFEAKSLNFSSMDEIEREKLYQAVISVLLKHILTKYTKDDLENVINQIMDFA